MHPSQLIIHNADGPVHRTGLHTPRANPERSVAGGAEGVALEPKTVRNVHIMLHKALTDAVGLEVRGVLGASEAEAEILPPLSDNIELIKDYLRGDNPLIPSADAMIKTTPPGRGSRLLRIGERNPIYIACVRTVAGVDLARAGEFSDADLGVSCYHSKVGAVELMLNHLLDQAGEYVVVDMTAGADAFASGLFTRFDVTFLVCEPTARSVGVYRQYQAYARDCGVQLAVIGNKIMDGDDLSYLRGAVGADLLTTIHTSAYVRAAERGSARGIEHLEPGSRRALDTMLEIVDAGEKDWAKFQAQAIEFHLRNAKAWAGEGAAGQIDPDFTFGPAVESLAAV